MYKSVIFNENEYVPVHDVTSGLYKTMTTLLHFCIFLYFLLSITNLYEIRINKCKLFNEFYFKSYFDKLSH